MTSDMQENLIKQLNESADNVKEGGQEGKQGSSSRFVQTSEETKDVVVKSMTKELVNMKNVEIPSEIAGFNSGLLKSNVDNLSADQKLEVDACLTLNSLEARFN